MDPLGYAALLVVLALNGWATAAVLRAEDLEAKQRGLQLLLTWLVPVLGPLTIIIFLWSRTPGSLRRHADTEHEHWQNAQDKSHAIE